MKICIMGTQISCGNRGVLALGASLVNLCVKASDGGEVTLLMGNKDNQPAFFRVGGAIRPFAVVNCRLSPRSRPSEHFAWILLAAILYRLVPIRKWRSWLARATPWINTLAEADLVGDVRGGDSFSDIYGLRRFIMGFFVIWSVILVRGSITQFPQTYGPYKSPVARSLARYLLKRSSTIIARDKKSRAVAQDLVGPAKQVLLSPDVAFSLEAVRPAQISTDPPFAGAVPARSIGLNVNGLMYNGGYTRNNMFGLKLDYPTFLHELVVALLRKQAGGLWLIPHTYAPPGNVESDNGASEKLRASLPAELRQRVCLVTGEYDPHEVKWIIGQCDFFIGSRMHSCIAALSQGIPCVGVAYSMKFAGVFETVGMEKWVVDARVIGTMEAVTQILDLHSERNEVRKGLSKMAKLSRRQLDNVFLKLTLNGDSSGI